MANDRYFFDAMCWSDAGSVSSYDIESGGVSYVNLFVEIPICK
jgi:hypothetical protein